MSFCLTSVSDVPLFYAVGTSGRPFKSAQDYVIVFWAFTIFGCKCTAFL